MTDDVVTKLLPAIEIAAFRRAPDGSFTAVAPAPKWFARLVADVTFPFLGHILEEARLFWDRRIDGVREWGPSVEVDEAGREFHYRVLAVSVGGEQFLLFQLDPGSDRVREVLQQVREQALANPVASAHYTLTSVQQEVRRASDRIHELVRPLLGTGQRDQQFELWKTLSAVCDDLVQKVDAHVNARGIETTSGRTVPKAP